MRITANYLRQLIAEELDRALSAHLISEQEGEDKDEEKPAEDEGGDDAGDDLFGDTGDDEDAEGDRSATKKSAGAAAVDEEGEDDEEDAPEASGGEKEGQEEEEEEDEPPAEPTGPSGFEFDEEINAAMAGFEKRALDVAAAKQEGRVLSMARFLFEADEEDEVAFDAATFADDTARLIANYDTLIDMEQAIYTKAVDFVAEKYGEATAEQLKDILSMRYDIEFDQPNDPEADEREVYAAGATGGGGAA